MTTWLSKPVLIAILVTAAIAAFIGYGVYASLLQDEPTGTFSTVSETLNLEVDTYDKTGTLVTADWLTHQFTHTTGISTAANRPIGAAVVKNLTSSESLDYTMDTNNLVSNGRGLEDVLYIDIVSSDNINAPADCTSTNIEAIATPGYTKVTAALSALPAIVTPRTLPPAGQEVLCFRVTYDAGSGSPIGSQHVYGGEASAVFSFTGQ